MPEGNCCCSLFIAKQMADTSSCQRWQQAGFPPVMCGAGRVD